MLRRLMVLVPVTLLAFAAAEVLAHERYRIVGTVTKRQDTEIQVKTADDKKFTVFLDEQTVFQRDKKKVSKTELKLGQSVVVDALGDGEDDLGAEVVNIVPAIKPSPSPKTRPTPRR